MLKICLVLWCIILINAPHKGFFEIKKCLEIIVMYSMQSQMLSIDFLRLLSQIDPDRKVNNFHLLMEKTAELLSIVDFNQSYQNFLTELKSCMMIYDATKIVEKNLEDIFVLAYKVYFCWFIIFNRGQPPSFQETLTDKFNPSDIYDDNNPKQYEYFFCRCESTAFLQGIIDENNFVSIIIIVLLTNKKIT